MTTLKITFYKNIKCSSIGKPSFSYLRWKIKGVGNLMSGQNFFSQQIRIFFHKDIDNYEDECYDFQDELFNFEQILRMSRDN
jgi:hypothetical protein